MVELARPSASMLRGTIRQEYAQVNKTFTDSSYEGKQGTANAEPEGRPVRELTFAATSESDAGNSADSCRRLQGWKLKRPREAVR